MSLNIKGRMKVKTLKADFVKEFGLQLRVYEGNIFANDEATLASIRKGDSKGGEFAPRKNTKIGNLEDKIKEMFGIKTQVAGSDDSYLCDNDHTLAKALEVDEELMIKRGKRGDSPKTKPVESKTQSAMSLSDIINEVKNTYSEHEDFEDMIDDLGNGDSIAYWAEQLSTDEFNKNINLAKSLFEVAIEKAETSIDLIKLGNNIADSNGFNDKRWARELYKSAFKIAVTLMDFVALARSCINEEYLDDKVWAKELLKMSLEKAKNVNEFSAIADIISNIDKDWSREVFQKALDISSNDEEYKNIADTVQWLIKDPVWANEIREKYLGKEKGVKSAQQISDEIIERTNALSDPGDSIDEAEGYAKEAYDLYDSMYEEAGDTLDEFMGSDILSEEQKLKIMKTYIEYLEKLTGEKFMDIIEGMGIETEFDVDSDPRC